MRVLGPGRVFMAFAALGLAGLPAVAESQGTPCSEPMPQPAIPPEQLLSQRLSLPLNGETTLIQVRSALGVGSADGPAREILVYGVGVEDPGLKLWLSFEPTGERRLTRALLQYREHWQCTSHTTSTIFNNLEVTRQRRRDQLDWGRYLRPAEVYAAWGPPDDVNGLNDFYWHYRLADGGMADLLFRGGILMDSRFRDASGVEETH